MRLSTISKKVTFLSFQSHVKLCSLSKQRLLSHTDAQLSSVQVTVCSRCVILIQSLTVKKCTTTYSKNLDFRLFKFLNSEYGLNVMECFQIGPQAPQSIETSHSNHSEDFFCGLKLLFNFFWKHNFMNSHSRLLSSIFLCFFFFKTSLNYCALFIS